MDGSFAVKIVIKFLLTQVIYNVIFGPNILEPGATPVESAERHLRHLAV